MRKFILNGSVLAAVFGVRTALKESKTGPRDWALALIWVAWALNVAIAVAGVQRKSKQKELTSERKERTSERKDAVKG